MYQLAINDLSIDEFLRDYWQKKPLLIKQGFTDFIDPLTPDELAGLALEEEIQSRTVQIQGEHSDVAFGPIESYEHLGDTHWSLLVQACDFWNPNCAELVKPFRFIPNWRIDDLMVSFSTPHGGVGPHVDQYDVFIIQGMGKRHWRVGDKRDDYEVDHSNPALARIKGFEPIIDAVLAPGDILYIPPNFPHDGYAIEPSLNYSVGFRAPDQEAMFSHFADKLIDQSAPSKRYNDANRKVQQHHGELSADNIDALQHMMLECLQDREQFTTWLGEFLSDAKRDMNLIEVDEPYEREEIESMLVDSADAEFYRTGGLRCLYVDTPKALFINGESLDTQGVTEAFIIALCDEEQLNGQQLQGLLNTPADWLLWLHVINAGYWYCD